ncbi:MAG: helix-turn-helix domain-containing protein [Aeromicrobium erythreum]
MLQQPVPSDPTEDRVSRVAAAFIDERQQFIDALLRRTEETIPPLERDERLHALLDTSITENIVQVLNMLHNSIDTSRATAPAGAIAYAQRLAQRDVSVSELHSAYRLGLLMFLETAYAIASRHGLDDAATLSELMHRTTVYNDRVCADVGRAYDHERTRWLSTSAVARQLVIERLLRGESGSARLESELRYPMANHHLSFRIWIGPASGTVAATVDRTVRVITDHLKGSGAVLIDPVDDYESRGWIALPRPSRVDTTALIAALRAARLDVSVVLGPTLPGAVGFRRSHDLAADLQQVVVARPRRGAGPMAHAYDELAPVVLLGRDLPAARDFVQHTLGDLAHDDERSEGLRETLLTFLECNRSYALAAERMMLHRNTIRYRVLQACESSRQNLDDGRVVHALHTALLLTHWLGPGVAAAEPASLRQRGA